jgi:ankyrin repeat protein
MENPRWCKDLEFETRSTNLHSDYKNIKDERVIFSVNLEDYYLEYAIRANNLQLLNSVISKGKNINDKCIAIFFEKNDKKELIFPLCLAIMLEKKNIIKELLLAGADVKTTHSNSECSQMPYKRDCFEELLKLICCTDDEELLELLLINGFNPNQLMTNINPNQFVTRCRYPLNYIVENGTVKLAKVLVRYGSYVDGFEMCYSQTSLLESTNLYIAITKKINNLYDMVNFLLENKANPNKVQMRYNREEHTLSIAIQRGYIDIVYLLIKYGATLKRTDFNNIYIYGNRIYNMKHMMMIFERTISFELFRYFTPRTKNSFIYTLLCLRKYARRIKRNIVMKIIRNMLDLENKTIQY